MLVIEAGHSTSAGNALLRPRLASNTALPYSFLLERWSAHLPMKPMKFANHPIPDSGHLVALKSNHAFRLQRIDLKH